MPKMKLDWEKIKPDVQRLYKHEDKTLAEVMTLIKQMHGFQASERSFKGRIRKWRFTKYNTDGRCVRRGQIETSTHNTSGLNVAPNLWSALNSNTSTNLLSYPSQGHFDGFSPRIGNLLRVDIQYPPSPSIEASGNHPIGTSGQTPPRTLTFPGDFSSTVENSPSTHQADNVGHEQLHRAVLTGSENELKVLLSQGAPVSVRDRLGYEPLHRAVMNEDENLIQLLLNFGASIDAKVQMDRTALHLAVQTKVSLRALLQAECNVNAQDERGDTPLHLLLAKPQSDDSFDENIRLLINAGADVNITNNSRNSAFHLLLFRTDHDTSHVYKMVQHFIGVGANISLPNRYGRLPFDVFLQQSRFLNWRRCTYTSRDHSHFQKQCPDSAAHSCFLAFLESGVDVNVRGYSGELVAHLYLQQRYDPSSPITKKVRSLLTEKIDLDKMGKNGNHFIHELVTSVAASCHHTTGGYDSRTLLNRGGNPNLLNLQGQSPIMVLLAVEPRYVSEYWDREITNLLNVLLKRGADPWIRDNTGNLPIYEGVRKFPRVAREIAQILLLTRREEAASQDRETLERYDNARDGKDSSWWEAWDRAVAEDYWDQHKECFLVARRSLPADIQEIFYKISMGILAEIYLEKAQERFSTTETSLKERRSFMSSVTYY